MGAQVVPPLLAKVILYSLAVGREGINPHAPTVADIIKMNDTIAIKTAIFLFMTSPRTVSPYFYLHSDLRSLSQLLTINYTTK